MQEYLHQTYITEIDDMETRHRHYVCDNMHVVIEREDKSEQEIRVFFHDECILYTNDADKYYYAREADQELRNKGQGRCLHVYECIAEELGFLDL